MRTVIIICLFILSCNSNSQKLKEIKDFSQSSTDSMKSLNVSGKEFIKAEQLMKYKFIYTLKKKNGERLGEVYVRYKNNEIFTDLYIVRKVKGKIMVLYSINKNIFFSPNGKDIEVFKDGFYGYRFILKKDEYITISYLRNKGKNISDDITIEWNEKEGIFKVITM